jgi:hypothetical protein
MTELAFEFSSLFFTGILAGVELAVCIGVRTPLATLPEKPQIEFRQSLIRRLRVLVPAIFLPALATSIGAAVSSATSSPARIVGLVGLGVWTAVTFGRTAWINKNALTWNSNAPPPDWKLRVAAWERLDIVRTVCAMSAFLAFICASALSQ